MPPDPNARLLKAIESLTRSVDENTRQLKKLVDQGRRVRITNHPYLGSDDAASGSGEGTEETTPDAGGAGAPAEGTGHFVDGVFRRTDS